MSIYIFLYFEITLFFFYILKPLHNSFFSRLCHWENSKKEEKSNSSGFEVWNLCRRIARWLYAQPHPPTQLCQNTTD